MVTKKMKTAYLYSLKTGTFVYGFVLMVVVISNLSLLSSNWPFVLLTSFLGSLFLMLPIILILLATNWRKGLLPILLLGAWAFYPFHTHEKFVNPSLETCPVSDCISVISVNLQRNPDALFRFAQTQSEDTDIIILLELPLHMTSEALREAFTANKKLEIVVMSKQDGDLDSRLAVLSRKNLDDVELERLKFSGSSSKDRDVISFDYKTAATEPLSFVVVHAPAPLSRSTARARDIYFETVMRDLPNQARLIMVGDFNMTPWEKGYLELPGKRAGDPRWARTWNARRVWQNLVIDHGMIGQDIGVLETEVLPDIGSDHFPIRITVYARS